MPRTVSYRSLTPIIAFGLCSLASVIYGASRHKGIAARGLSSPDQPLKMEFVTIPKGEFTMGCSPSDAQCLSSEKPAHVVNISKSFELGKYEVTQSQWESVMGSNPSVFIGENRPVENMSWTDIQEFFGKLNARKDGFHYRLPTEAEWEYAARAGDKDIDPLTILQYAWTRENSEGTTHPVGQLKPNKWGLYDMLGNVAEWVQDFYDPTYYQSSPAADPQGPQGLRDIVLRGGSWGYSAEASRVSQRDFAQKWVRSGDWGFRCARDPAPLR